MSDATSIKRVAFSEKQLLLLKLMADGHWHSGESLGALLGVSRAAVWKVLEGICDHGVQITRVRGKGYCIEGGLSLLDEHSIRAQLPSGVSDRVSQIHVLSEVTSTNDFLLAQVNQSPERDGNMICLAEMQTKGRGRRGRAWQSPYARSLIFSVSQAFDAGVAAMEGLSLAVGLALAEGLSALGCPHVCLKWPNDILIGQAKLGGVLIEIAGDAAGRCHAVVGVGINISIPQEAMTSVEQPWCNLASVVENVATRSEIAAMLTGNVLRILQSFESVGFKHYKEVWESYSAHIGQNVRLTTPAGVIDGCMQGVSEKGALRLEVDGDMQEFIGGEISLRLHSSEERAPGISRPFKKGVGDASSS